MGAKYEVTGKTVIYTKDGVKIVDAEVRREFNLYLDTCKVRFKYNGCLTKFTHDDGDYILLGCARTVPTDNVYAKPAYSPQRIERAAEYGRSKFFRQMLELMRLAQWEPINPANYPMEDFVSNAFPTNKPLPLSEDEILYTRYGFNDAMKEWTENHYDAIRTQEY